MFVSLTVYSDYTQMNSRVHPDFLGRYRTGRGSTVCFVSLLRLDVQPSGMSTEWQRRAAWRLQGPGVEPASPVRASDQLHSGVRDYGGVLPRPRRRQAAVRRWAFGSRCASLELSHGSGCVSLAAAVEMRR